MSTLRVADKQLLGDRQLQEDSYKVTDLTLGGREATLLVLADGMGGHRNGALASALVAEEFTRSVVAQAQQGQVDLRSAAISANACLSRHSVIDPTTRGMGTTLLAVLVHRGSISW